MADESEELELNETLLATLQRYLAKEGLERTVQPKRKGCAGRLGAGIVLLAWLAIVGQSISLEVGVHVGVLFALLLLFLTCTGVAINEIAKKYSFLDGIGPYLALLSVPLGASLLTFLLTRSFESALRVLLASCIGLPFLVAMNLILVSSRRSFRAYIRDLRSTIGLFAVLLSISTVVVLLSIFSSELWQAMAELTIERVWLLVGLIGAPSIVALLFMLSSISRDLMDRVVGERLQTRELWHLLKVSGYEVDDSPEAMLTDPHIQKLAAVFEKARDIRHWDITRETARAFGNQIALDIAGVYVFVGLVLLVTSIVYFAALLRLVVTDALLLDWTGQASLLRVRSCSLAHCLEVPQLMGHLALVLATLVSSAALIDLLVDDVSRRRLLLPIESRTLHWTIAFLTVHFLKSTTDPSDAIESSAD